MTTVMTHPTRGQALQLYNHRHFMGEVEEIEFPGFEALVDRFQKEVEDLWRAEDEQEY